MNFDNEIKNQLQNYLAHAGKYYQIKLYGMLKLGGKQIKYGGS
jgi:hypothetical protein